MAAFMLWQSVPQHSYLSQEDKELATCNTTRTRLARLKQPDLVRSISPSYHEQALVEAAEATAWHSTRAGFNFLPRDDRDNELRRVIKQVGANELTHLVYNHRLAHEEFGRLSPNQHSALSFYRAWREQHPYWADSYQLEGTICMEEGRHQAGPGRFNVGDYLLHWREFDPRNPSHRTVENPYPHRSSPSTAATAIAVAAGLQGVPSRPLQWVTTGHPVNSRCSPPSEYLHRAADELGVVCYSMPHPYASDLWDMPEGVTSQRLFDRANQLFLAKEPTAVARFPNPAYERLQARALAAQSLLDAEAPGPSAI